VLGAATVVLIAVMRHVVSPALRRRSIDALERENDRLDRLIDDARERNH
jgi:hypothetical protein